MARGDHLYVWRGVYQHHGIDCGDGTVVHYNGAPLRGRSASIVREPIEKFAKGGRVQIHNRTRRFSRTAIVNRALSRLGESEYQLLVNNCEHFVEWCCRGAKRSRQIENLVRIIGPTTTAVLAGRGKFVGVTVALTSISRVVLQEFGGGNGERRSTADAESVWTFGERRA